jgi:hypothetical protein
MQAIPLVGFRLYPQAGNVTVTTDRRYVFKSIINRATLVATGDERTYLIPIH